MTDQEYNSYHCHSCGRPFNDGEHVTITSRDKGVYSASDNTIYSSDLLGAFKYYCDQCVQEGKIDNG